MYKMYSSHKWMWVEFAYKLEKDHTPHRLTLWCLVASSTGRASPLHGGLRVVGSSPTLSPGSYNCVRFEHTHLYFML